MLQERSALKISEDIDHELRLELQTARRHKCVKVLLLGQSESGEYLLLGEYICSTVKRQEHRLEKWAS